MSYTIILIAITLLLLLAAWFIIVFATYKSSDFSKVRNARKHVCKDCCFCKSGACCYYMEMDIDVNRPACRHWEEIEVYKPA